MPKISQYIPEEGGAAPVRATPGGSIGQANQVAIGLERLGGATEELGTAIEQRQTQDEISGLSLKLSKNFSDQNEKLADQVQKGTLDTDQFSSEMADDFQTIGDGIQTHGGQRYYAKQSALMQRHLMGKMVAGRAELAGAKMQADYVESNNVRANNLLRNPEDLAVELESHDTTLQDFVSPVDGGPGLDYARAQALAAQGRQHLVKASIQGAMRLNTTTAPDQAKAMLDAGVAYGQPVDKLISGDLKEQLYGEIESTKNKNRIAKNLAEQAAADAQAAKQDKVTIENVIPEAAAGTLTLSKIEQYLPGDAKAQEHWLDKSYQWAKRKEEGNPQDELELRRRILLPAGDPEKISTLSQLQNASRGRNVSGSTYKSLANFMEKDTVEGRSLTKGRQDFDKLAKTLAHTDPVTGQQDPKGQILYRQAWEMAEAAEAKFEKEGKDPRELYSTKSESYLGNQLGDFKRSFTEIMQEQAEAFKKAATDPNLVPMFDPDGRPVKVKPEDVQKAIDAHYTKRKK